MLRSRQPIGLETDNRGLKEMLADSLLINCVVEIVATIGEIETRETMMTHSMLASGWVPNGRRVGFMAQDVSRNHHLSRRLWESRQFLALLPRIGVVAFLRRRA